MVVADIGVRTGKKQKAKAVSKLTLTKGNNITTNTGASSMKMYKDGGFTIMPGFQLRYIFLYDKNDEKT